MVADFFLHDPIGRVLVMYRVEQHQYTGAQCLLLTIAMLTTLTSCDSDDVMVAQTGLRLIGPDARNPVRQRPNIFQILAVIEAYRTLLLR